MATSAMIPITRASQMHAAPASRSSWCGQLRLGDLCVPVKAYAAIATPPETPLRQLHDLCGQRIEYRKSCPKHGAVPPEEIVKGYPYQPDQYVQFSTDELERLQPEDDKPSDRLTRPKTQRKLAVAQKFAALDGWRARRALGHY